MLFNSVTYFIFLLALYILYRALPYRKQNILLIIASYIFYGWWDIRFLFLIILSTVVNYCCGIIIKDEKITLKQRMAISVWLIVSCFLLVIINWNCLTTSHANLADCVEWIAILSNKGGWIIFLLVCGATLTANFFYSKIASTDKNKKHLFYLILGISANLSILGFFKYYNFFIDNIEWTLEGLNLDPARFHLNIILPIGISFYTFKGIGYLVDVHRGDVEPEYCYNKFTLFLVFFPALLAGPIDRAKNLLKQINKPRKIVWDQSLNGIHLIVYGLFKKVVIADGVIRTVNSVFSSTGYVSWIDVVVATIFFTLQIYCDFSGYTDIARGTAKLFGIDLMINFNLPYFSQNPQEFWLRWHISLSSWLRDYLYIPLGGNRKGLLKTYRNLMITMVLGGLWHGAAWNFILWGFFHGVVLSVHRAISRGTKRNNSKTSILSALTKTSLFFIITCYGWLIFRSPSLEKVLALSSTLIFDFGNLNFGATRPRLAALIGLPVFFIIEFVEYANNGKNFYISLPVPIWTAFYACIIFGLVIGLSTGATHFIYFNF